MGALLAGKTVIITGAGRGIGLATALHLHEEGAQVVATVRSPEHLSQLKVDDDRLMAEAQAPEFDSAWVDDAPELEARYGTRVPVLRDMRDGRELDWPFDAATVRAFLAAAL